METTPIPLPVIGTILEETAAILASGTFDSDATDPVADGETPVGTLNDFEKALYSSGNHHIDRVLARIRAMTDTDGGNDRTTARAVGEELWEEKAVGDILLGLMWTSVRKRLGRRVCGESGLVIREGYRVVRPAEPDTGPSPQALLSDIGTSLQAMRSDLSAHGICH